MDLNTVSLIGTAIKLSFEIYDKGFKKEKSSPQRYIEFGSVLHGLYSNLKTIETIIKRANNDLKSEKIFEYGPPTFDLAPLVDIIGNFRVTLEECRELLNDESKFRQKNGVVTNILYNIDVDPYVIQLTDRLNFHNTKISLILEPFQLHLQSQLRRLQVEQHQDISERVSELRQLVVSAFDLKDDGSLSPAFPRDLTIPIELNQRFVDACRQKGPNMQDGDRMFARFPLRQGLEAFFHHFHGLSQPLDSMSYLRLLKSIWVMDRLRECDEWSKIQRTNPGGLYDRCIREMDRRLRDECSRVTPSQIPLPGLLLQLPEDTFSIWPPATNHIQPTHISHLGVLLEVPILPDPLSHSLRVVRNIDGTLGVQDTTVTTTESTGTVASETRIQTVNIDPKSAYFVPIYATPVERGTSAATLMVKLQASRNGINGVAPEFQSSEDLLRLQHLITGFKCVKQRNGITVRSLVEGQDFPQITNGARSRKRKREQLEELGTIQLWQKNAFDNGLSPVDTNTRSDRRASRTSQPTAIKSIESSMSFSTLGSMSSAHAKQVTLGTSGTGIQLKQPERPSLVLFLKEKETGLLSFLVVELDELTHINPLSCDCSKRKKICTRSVLERRKSPLVARRFYATEGLNSWNLAALGEYWPLGESGAVPVQNMYWLELDFPNDQERASFNKNIATMVTMFTGRMEDYRKDLKNIRGTHIISRWN